jgi:hypothetical protein
MNNPFVEHKGTFELVISNGWSMIFDSLSIYVLKKGAENIIIKMNRDMVHVVYCDEHDKTTHVRRIGKGTAIINQAIMQACEK